MALYGELALEEAGYGPVVRENTEQIYALHRAGSTSMRRTRSRRGTKLGGKDRKQE